MDRRETSLRVRESAVSRGITPLRTHEDAVRQCLYGASSGCRSTSHGSQVCPRQVPSLTAAQNRVWPAITTLPFSPGSHPAQHLRSFSTRNCKTALYRSMGGRIVTRPVRGTAVPRHWPKVSRRPQVPRTHSTRTIRPQMRRKNDRKTVARRSTTRRTPPPRERANDVLSSGKEKQPLVAVAYGGRTPNVEATLCWSLVHRFIMDRASIHWR